MRWMLAVVMVALGSGAAAQDRAWIEASDRYSNQVFEALGGFFPEWMSELGLERYDAEVRDLKPRHVERADAALGAIAARLRAARLKEQDSRVREDLDILVDALARMRHTAALERRLLVPHRDLPRQIFEGLQGLLDKRNADSRKLHALERLRRYAGMTPGTRPLAELARERTLERANAELIWPYRGEVEQELGNCQRYVAGIAELLRASPVQGWEPAHERLAGQLGAHCDWVRSAVLPRARPAPAFPAELYADRLKRVGVDITPEQAIALGTTAFAEVREQMGQVAATLAAERKLPSADYREVLRALKRESVPEEHVLDLYKERLAQIEAIIARERLITLPQRPAAIRLASEAESAAIPAPYMNAPRLIGNKGELGEFVIPLTNPNAQGGARNDDFTPPAAAWSLTAHEARPGHELQFASMVERGVSLARAVFASNSTNAEGWGLYAEAIMLPYYPEDGRLFALQLRLMRAARAFLDPMVNLGRMSPQAAKDFLVQEVLLSDAMAQQEADRYAFRWPGQAVSYLYGYSRLRELRMKAEIALREKFDQREFHDLIIAQGLLPPRLLESAVMGELTRRYPDTSTARGLPGSVGSRSPTGAPAR
jgi:polyhydroxyalkanoate synthesis regulator phasin